ncbi:ABC transporter ATP-binding protein [Paenibacillus albidus]|uniref:ABC transporter ATP-binding protein n=1 Tax=Paenibacillus albidus TaxID=2041023 RepID=UPI001BE5133F|nr:ABC transporter ATP-binding protein [Paenibacillus albidus]MBT2291849.1 ABC transporter ATP-binding protein [Paenibacillus albidus]
MSNIVLKVENLQKSFGKKKIIDNISFTVEKGDVFGFLGPNGSGKTTTIRMMLGLLKPDHGDVQIINQSVQSNFYGAVSKVGALVEGPAFYEYMTAIENLEAFAAYSGNSDKQLPERLLKVVGLENRGNDKVKDYSLGMKQRLGIAQALLNEPELLILDEPTNGLDPQGIKEIREMIIDLSRQGMTIFLSSHILSEVEQICNKVTIINKGKNMISGFTKELVGISKSYDIEAVEQMSLLSTLEKINGVTVQEAGEIVKVRLADELPPEQLLYLLIKHEVKVIRYTPVKSSLEEYFFDVVGEKE